MSNILALIARIALALFLLVVFGCMLYMLALSPTKATPAKDQNLSQPISKQTKQKVKSSFNEKTSNEKFITNGKIDSLIALAKSKLGAKYVPGKAGPNTFDCSGFVYYIFKEQGRVIPRTSISQSKIGKKLDKSEIQRGDILFFNTANSKHVNHSGIYLGENKFIHASSGEAYSVTISNLDGWYKDKFLWGIRVFNQK
ncbi:MAG: C40 family peptidase [Campylobacterales bacterium]|nr:C40 family peptidase [Campylobacterales bacterium]